MPVRESTDRLMPRSALRHRSLQTPGDQQGKRPSAAVGITPVAQRASRLRPKSTEDDEDGRSGGASAAARSVRTPKTPHVKRRVLLRGHPILYLGVGMIAMLALWMLLTSAIAWWNTTMDDLHYGRPRTFQMDAVVGHNDSAQNPSHFIALNLHGHIEIIEFPGQDASKARIYMGPQLYGAGSDLVPVTLSFVDVTGDHQPDMVVHFQNTQIVYINDQGSFRPARPDELPAIQHYLCHFFDILARLYHKSCP